MIFWIIVLLITVYVLAYFFFPKGNFIQEGLTLPIYLWKTKKVNTQYLKVQKYQFGSHRQQYYLWFASNPSVPRRNHLIIYYHGGGWQFGSPEQFAANAKVFVDLGYEVIMPAHRKIPFYSYTSIREDLSLTLKHIKSQFEEQNRPIPSIVLGGMSSGANLVALMHYDQKNLQEVGWQQNQFKGIFLCGGPLDLSKMWQSPSLCFLGRSFRKNALLKASPSHYIATKESTPFLCIHGTKDGFVEYKASAAFVEQLKKVQHENISFHTIEGGTHLDIGSWVHTNNEIRKLLKEWVLKFD